MQYNAFLYPTAPGARKEITDGREIGILRPELLAVEADGSLRILTVAKDGPLAYNKANTLLFNQNSSGVYVTVSCADPGRMDKLCGNATKRTGAITFIRDFLERNGFDGVNVDFEPAGQWTQKQTDNFLLFLKELTDDLQMEGYGVEVCMPPITAKQDPANGQQLYKITYEAVAATGATLVIMAYDKQYDYGVGTPVAPLDFIDKVCKWAKAKLTPGQYQMQLDIALPTYGYTGKKGQYTCKLMTYTDAKNSPNAARAKRNADGEMEWYNGVTYFCYQDQASIGQKVAVVEKNGILVVSFWVLGNNLWP